MKGFVIFFDKEGAWTMKIKPGQIDINETEADIKLTKKGLAVIRHKPINIKVNPIDKNGKPNLVTYQLYRKFINIGSIEHPIIKFMESRREYKKREKEILKKMIKR